MTNPPPFWSLTAQDQRALFTEASKRLKLPEHMVEKDAWVCWTLKRLFDLPYARDHFIFKGGTSLSKVWKVIKNTPSPRTEIQGFQLSAFLVRSPSYLGFGLGPIPNPCDNDHILQPICVVFAPRVKHIFSSSTVLQYQYRGNLDINKTQQMSSRV